ncbi:hypothetical protein, partial [Oceanisphaera ostreae]
MQPHLCADLLFISEQDLAATTFELYVEGLAGSLQCRKPAFQAKKYRASPNTDQLRNFGDRLTDPYTASEY